MFKHEMEELKKLQNKKELNEEEKQQNLSLIFRLATHRKDIAICENVKED